MIKTTITLLLFCITFLSFGQVTEKQKMIELGKVYKDFMFRNEPAKEVLKDVKSDVPENLKTAVEFITQTITTKNGLLTQAYLARPDDKVLKQIYIIRAINLNLREEFQVDNNKLIDSLSGIDISVNELVDNYYEMLFTAVGNKNQPFNLSKTDLKLNDYNLKNDTERGILVLKAISFCGTTIWGYMNIVKPANTQKAYDHIKKFPEINGRPYFQYTDFYFPDFEMKIVKDKGIQSYKTYYIDKYFEVLLNHLICLNKENASEKEINDLLLGSILKERNLYKYTKYRETLEGIFKVQKTE
jgi:hypothetical protein